MVEEYLRELKKNCYSLGRAEFQFRQGERGSPATDVSRDEEGGFNFNTFGSQLIKRVAIRKIQNKYLCPESIILLFKDRHICQVKSSFTFKGDHLYMVWLWRTMPNQQYFLHAQGCPWVFLVPAAVC